MRPAGPGRHCLFSSRPTVGMDGWIDGWRRLCAVRAVSAWGKDGRTDGRILILTASVNILTCPMAPVGREKACQQYHHCKIFRKNAAATPLLLLRASVCLGVAGRRHLGAGGSCRALSGTTPRRRPGWTVMAGSVQRACGLEEIAFQKKKRRTRLWFGGTMVVRYRMPRRSCKEFTSVDQACMVT